MSFTQDNEQTPEPVVLTGASGNQYELGATIGSWAETPASECDAPNGGRYYGPNGTIVCRCIVCGRCGRHTGNSNQGHYWAYCNVTKSKREFHLCCPGDCQLEASTDATRVQIPVADVNESADELQSAAEREQPDQLSTVTVLRTIAQDMAEDAKAFDGKPFTGSTVGEQLGNQGAAIAAVAEILADSLEALVEQLESMPVGGCCVHCGVAS